MFTNTMERITLLYHLGDNAETIYFIIFKRNFVFLCQIFKPFFQARPDTKTDVIDKLRAKKARSVLVVANNRIYLFKSK